MNPASSMRSFAFSNLPRELRDQIYRRFFAYIDRERNQRVNRGGYYAGKYLDRRYPILQVSTQVRQEAAKMLYEAGYVYIDLEDIHNRKTGALHSWASLAVNCCRKLIVNVGLYFYEHHFAAVEQGMKQLASALRTRQPLHYLRVHFQGMHGMQVSQLLAFMDDLLAPLMGLTDVARRVDIVEERSKRFKMDEALDEADRQLHRAVIGHARNSRKIFVLGELQKAVKTLKCRLAIGDVRPVPDPVNPPKAPKRKRTRDETTEEAEKATAMPRKKTKANGTT